MDLKQRIIEFIHDRYINLIDIETLNIYIEIALYWYASDNHSGQFSELYEILSNSYYKPSLFSKSIQDEDALSIEIYELIEENFKL